jgi:hypothetical protein
MITACASVTGQFAPRQVKTTYPPRTRAENIELFRSQLPTKKYIEIGAVNACCFQDTNLLVAELRKKASENGGDALTGFEIDATGGAFASVIRYEDAH